MLFSLSLSAQAHKTILTAAFSYLTWDIIENYSSDYPPGSTLLSANIQWNNKQYKVLMELSPLHFILKCKLIPGGKVTQILQ